MNTQVQIDVHRGSTHLTTWIENTKSIKKNNFIRFKESLDWWIIDKVYDRTLEKNEIHRSWKVGGQ